MAVSYGLAGRRRRRYIVQGIFRVQSEPEEGRRAAAVIGTDQSGNVTWQPDRECNAVGCGPAFHVQDVFEPSPFIILQFPCGGVGRGTGVACHVLCLVGPGAGESLLAAAGSGASLVRALRPVRP